jgi:hypothetical protein
LRLVDKVDILRAQIASMKALARDVGTDPDKAAQPYVDMLLELLDAELAGVAALCRADRTVAGLPSYDAQEDAARAEFDGVMRSLDLDGRRFVIRESDRLYAFRFGDAFDATIAPLLGRRVRVLCRSRTAEVPRAIYVADEIIAI